MILYLFKMIKEHKNILRISNIGFISLAFFAMSFKNNCNHPDKTTKDQAGSSIPGSVIFSVDAYNTLGNKNRRLDFYYHDSLAYGHPVAIAGTGTRVLLNSPALLFEASDKQTPFLIYPGEKINIKYAETDSVQMYIKDNQLRTNELNFFKELVQKTGNVYYAFKTMPYHKKTTTANGLYTLEKTINDIKNARLKFLGSFSRQFVISNSFKKIAVNVIKSTALTDTLMLYSNNIELLRKQNIYKKLIAEKLATLRNVGFMPLQNYFRMCTTLVSLSLTNKSDHILSNTDDFTKRFDFVIENFVGPTKDFLMSNTVYAAYTNTITISKKYLNQFNTQCQDEGYKRIIDKKLHEKQVLMYSKGNNELLFVDGVTTQDMQTVMSKYKGKIVLLDFWASWCSPCREEMPKLEILKRSYKGKNIVFITISKDASIANWITANKEESLGNDNSFLLLNAEQSPLVKQYKINTIPRYILIGKDGKVINDDAPRPSDPKLKNLLAKFF